MASVRVYGQSTEDLDVRIPERFKKGLSARFDPAGAKPQQYSGWKIAERCELCDAFYVPHCCKNCPFASFRNDQKPGCEVWIDTILGDTVAFFYGRPAIVWRENRDVLARQQLARLRERAEELIDWVADEPAEELADKES